MSTKSTAQKLLIKPDDTLWLSHPERLELVGGLPPGVVTVDDLVEADVVLLFTDDAASLERSLAVHGESLRSRGKVTWFAYPKGNRTDLNRDSLWPVVGRYGLRPITQIAVDETWSALRFRPLAEGEKQFSGGKAR